MNTKKYYATLTWNSLINLLTDATSFGLSISLFDTMFPSLTDNESKGRGPYSESSNISDLQQAITGF